MKTLQTILEVAMLLCAVVAMALERPDYAAFFMASACYYAISWGKE